MPPPLPTPPVPVVIAYHSETGNTRAMADLIAEGVTSSTDAASGADPAPGLPSENQFAVQFVDVTAVGEAEVAVLDAARVLFVGCPTYYGTISWPMKQFLDTIRRRGVSWEGVLAAPFASANWPGGGGYETTLLALVGVLLIKGALVYTGGIRAGKTPTHYGAVSQKAPTGFDADRCRQLGRNVARKARELFTSP